MSHNRTLPTSSTSSSGPAHDSASTPSSTTVHQTFSSASSTSSSSSSSPVHTTVDTPPLDSFATSNSTSSSSTAASTTLFTPIGVASPGSNLYIRNTSSRPGSPPSMPHLSSAKSESYYADTSFSVGKAGFDPSRASHPKKHDRWLPNNAHSGPKRWRWWNYLAVLLLAFAAVETMVFLLGSSALYSLPEQIQIDSREFRRVTYQGLALDAGATYKKPIQVYHVTKEFGPASMGGLGMVVTALATAQQRARTQKVNIVLPYYTMLDKLNLEIKAATTLSMEIKDNRQRTREVTFPVYRFKYEFLIPEADQMDPKRPVTPITVWLIGRADMYPFDRAFESKNIQEIYYSPHGLPGEWKDLYFAKAAATFIQHQNKNNEVSLFAPAASRGSGVDIVHIHGATNAFVLQYLQQAIDRGFMGEAPPALIYTLHDYLDELQYSNEIKNVEKFMDRHIHSSDDEEDLLLQMENIAPYCHGHRMFTSAMGVDLADMVTFVSKTMAKDIVEGRLDFYLKELVLGSILNRASKNQFIGITNGVDFGKLNPWTMPQLRSQQLDFPTVEGASMVNLDSPTLNEDGTTAVSYKSSNPTIREAKAAAKYYLKSKGLLTEQDLDKPLILFIGRFQYNKGLEFFTTACQAIKERGGLFVIMGQPNNFPLKSIYNLERLYKGTVSIIADPKQQDEWGVYWRAAADFLLVPSLTESFGLVAAEGLLFGSTVISSGVGGLSEFLVDRPNPDDPVQQREDKRLEQQQKILPQDQLQPVASREERYNSYLFDALAPQAHAQLSNAIRDAIQHWRTIQRQPQMHEAFLQRLVSSALAMGWDRPGGPVDQYRALYEVALENISGGEASL